MSMTVIILVLVLVAFIATVCLTALSVVRWELLHTRKRNTQRRPAE